MRLRTIIIKILIKLIGNDFRELDHFEIADLPCGMTITASRKMMVEVNSTGNRSVDHKKLMKEIYEYMDNNYKYLCDPMSVVHLNHYSGRDSYKIRIVFGVWKRKAKDMKIGISGG